MTKSQADPFKYFRIEAVELIDKLTRGLLTLENNDGSPDFLVNRAASDFLRRNIQGVPRDYGPAGAPPAGARRLNRCTMAAVAMIGASRLTTGTVSRTAVTMPARKIRIR